MSAERPRAFLSYREVRERLGKRHAFVQGLVERGALETVEVEGVKKITAASFDRYVGRVPQAQSVAVDPRALAGLFRQFADFLERGAA